MIFFILSYHEMGDVNEHGGLHDLVVFLGNLCEFGIAQKCHLASGWYFEPVVLENTHQVTCKIAFMN